MHVMLGQHRSSWDGQSTQLVASPPAGRTFSIARAMSSPISRSPLAEMVPTCMDR